LLYAEYPDLEVAAFRDVTLCRWASSCRYFEKSWWILVRSTWNYTAQRHRL